MLRQDKRGQIPSHLAQILERLEIEKRNWLHTVEKYGGWFSYAAGRTASMIKAAQKFGRQWLKGMAQSRTAFSTTKEPNT